MAGRAAGISLSQVSLAGTLLGAMVLLGLAAFSSHLLKETEKRQQQSQGKLLTGGAAAQIGAALERYSVSVGMAAGDPDLAAAIIAGDADYLRAQEQDLRVRLGAARVRLASLSGVPPQAGDYPELTFADLELVQAAVSGALPAAEVHLTGTSQAHLDIVRRIPGIRGGPAGALVVSYPVSILQDIVRRIPLAEGSYLELLQDGVVLTARGDRQAATLPAFEQRIADTRWTVRLRASPADAPLSSHMGLWAGFGVAMFVLALIAWLLSRAAGRVLKEDLATLTDLVHDIRAGRSSRAAYTARLAELRSTMDLLAALRHLPGRVLSVPDFPTVTPVSVPSPPKAVIPQAPNYLPKELNVSEMTANPRPRARTLPDSIFRAYDIRGVVGDTLTEDIVYDVGLAIGSEAYARGQQAVIVARDGRLSGPTLLRALSEGLRASGRDVIDVGLVPTPVLYFAAHYLNTESGVMLTGSHNPPDYNGLKIVLRGETLAEDDIQALKRCIERGDLTGGAGSLRSIDVVSDYIHRITSDVRLARPLKVVVDCGNGVAGAVAPKLLRALGCDVIELHCDVDGTFPNHHPDPSQPENLEDLIQTVRERGADLGLAFDGDGDRLGVVDGDGMIIWPDRQMMLYAGDILSRHPGAQIMFDVKCSRHLARVIAQQGGQPLMWKTGHSLIKRKMKETGALLAGEMSGHIFFKERWFGFDDALYTAARLLEILSAHSRPPARVFAELPDAVSTPELRIDLREGEQKTFMAKLLKIAQFKGAAVTTIDGLRVDFDDGWGLVRASNTTPSLILRFEANTSQALKRIQDDFAQLMRKVDSQVALPF